MSKWPHIQHVRILFFLSMMPFPLPTAIHADKAVVFVAPPFQCPTEHHSQCPEHFSSGIDRKPCISSSIVRQDIHNYPFRPLTVIFANSTTSFLQGSHWNRTHVLASSYFQSSIIEVSVRMTSIVSVTRRALLHRSDVFLPCFPVVSAPTNFPSYLLWLPLPICKNCTASLT